MKKEILVAIVDDHPMIISGLKNMLSGQAHIHIMDAFPDGQSLLNGLAECTPDVILLDIQLPDISGDELVPLVLSAAPQTKILALTNFDSPLYLHTMLRQGVNGYLLKTTTQDTLIAAIKAVHQGIQFIEPSLEKRMNEEKIFDRKPYAKLSLTLREKEIVRLLADGLDNKAISEKLFIGYHTVRNYRARIFAKLEVNSISELVKKALTLGL